ncbi:MAG: 50S ribosomal protein L23 [Deltaproteobacteria bacterium]|nr:50S ribosomal protein L23 [Deltaproteobacteria bacterium]
MASINKSPYSIILKPVITEKAAVSGSKTNSTAVFEVHPKANKIEIKKAIEKIFDVKVKAVRTLNYQGKVKRVYSRTGMQKSTKRAYVSLQAGHTINVIEGL